ncbi:MAG: DNA polymerase I [Acidobacteria bacterium]|nr:DNA polymerase I [Acidobacteriota bacterium]
MSDSTVYILDTLSQVFRAYYAIQGDFTAPDGTPVKAVFGFVHMLRKLMETRKPAYFVAAADPGGPTLRHRKAAAYKANRKPVPEDLKAQVPLVFDVLGAFGIPVLVVEGFEADDVIARLVREARANGREAVVLSSDKDLFQLVGDGVTVADTRADVTYGPEEVKAKFGVPPERITDYLALTGDASDNIPGAPGIGPKTAVALLEQFGSLDACLDRLEEVKSERIRGILRENRQRVLDSRELATLMPDLPLDWGWADLRPFRPDWERVHHLALHYGFRSLLGWIAAQRSAGAPAEPDVPPPPPPPSGGAEGVPGRAPLPPPGGLLDGIPPEDGLGVGPAPRGVDAGPPPRGLSVKPLPGSVDIIPQPRGAMTDIRSALESGTPLAVSLTGPGVFCFHPEGSGRACLAEGLDADAMVAAVLGGKGPLRVCGLKAVCRRDPRWEGVVDRVEDVSLMHYLVFPHVEDHTLPRIALDVAGLELPPDPPEGEAGGLLAAADDTPENAARRAAALHPCARALSGRLAALGLDDLYRGLELPLVPILARMERAGVLLDLPWLRTLSGRMASRLAEHERNIHGLAGEVFNVNSPVQLGYILFDKLGIHPPGRLKRTKKTGRYATGAEVLEQLAPLHPLPAAILEHRRLAKLKSTYVDVLPRLADPRTGRVHTTFRQDVASTGRLSSANPNLQNIPIRTEEGREIRKAFVAPEGSVLLCADYSQVELRIVAHLSGDAGLAEAFRRDEDIHTSTAKAVFGSRYAESPKEFRRRAKAINYGILYGQSEFGLSGGLAISRGEAKEIIEAYFRTFPGVKRWVQDNLERARTEGAVRTLFGRVRPMPELESSNGMVRQAGERVATNAPVQGTAADIMKRAMLRLDRALADGGFQSRPLLQVHDELVLECPVGELPVMRGILRSAMEGAAELAVPLVADVSEGHSWFDAKA